MSYAVVWVPAAEQELAQLWLDAARRREVALAAQEIDSRLRFSPAQQGESRTQGRRILLVLPLGVTLEILPEDRLVRVLDVWRFEKRR